MWLIKMKSSAIICPCEKQNCRGDEAGREKTARLWYWCATVRDTDEPLGTSSDQTDSSDDVIKMSARGCLMKEKEKNDGKPEGRVIRGAAEHGRWSRGKQWNVKKLWLEVQESVADHHEHNEIGSFFLSLTHLSVCFETRQPSWSEVTVWNYAS